MRHVNTEVIYQIYPLTFNYASGSKTDPYKGTYGNLKGITALADYVKSLGVDTIWITPFYPWGGYGFGYDITNYCAIDPMYGDVDDFKELCDVYHAKGIKIIIDQVYNHCSIKHEWFRKSVEKVKPYDEFFIWADPKMHNDKLSPPNNWISTWDSIGERAWTFHPERAQYYMHSFDWSMPNLNLNNKIVQDEILKISKFWFDLGVDGFRLDAVTHYACDEQLRDNPVYDNGYQVRLYDINSPNGALFINRLKSLCDSYSTPKTLLAEYWYDKSVAGFEKARQIISSSRCDAFFTGALNSSINTFKGNIIEDLSVSPYGEKLNWALSNHDLERVTTRLFGDGYNIKKARLLMDMLLTLPGSICIYQGEELGLPKPKSIEACKNPDNDPLNVWASCNKVWDACRAGFAISDAKDDPSRNFALHPDDELYKYAVSNQIGLISMLETTKRLIKNRKESVFGQLGSMYFVDTYRDDVVAYVRTNVSESERVLCIYNFSNDNVSVCYDGQKYCLYPESVKKCRL